MKTRTFLTLKAVRLLSRLGGARITVGQVAGWSNTSYSTAKRHLMQLRKWGLVEYELFPFAGRDCRDWFLTQLGDEIYESQLELPVGSEK